jgi:UDP-N-acetylmuramate--alanine ligase
VTALAQGRRLDLSVPRRVHVVGVGGAGMSALATALAGMGHRVSGSDVKESAVLERLRASGVAVRVGHDPAYVRGADAVAYSSAVPETNPELAEARRRGILLLHRAEALASVAATRRVLAVAGSHGKTTTASMLALILVDAGMRPSFIIGGELNEVGTGAVWDRGEWLVVEADESDGSFLELAPEAAVLTSVEPDHLDAYGSIEALERAFGRFMAQTGGLRVYCADDPAAAALAQASPGLTYGTAVGADYRLVRVRPGRQGVAFELAGPEGPLGRVRLRLPGRHNALNAAAATALAMGVGASFADCQRALSRFTGVARRFELRGRSRGVTFVDDYAHNPGKVRAALEAAREGDWERVVCVFQPHRYSRTHSLQRHFAGAFDRADLVVVTDVYPAGEEPVPGVSGQLIVDEVRRASPWLPVEYLPTRHDLLERLPLLLRPGDLCLTLGAGDLTSLPDELMTLPRW